MICGHPRPVNVVDLDVPVVSCGTVVLCLLVVGNGVLVVGDGVLVVGVVVDVPSDSSS